MQSKPSQNISPPARNKVTESVTLDWELGEWLREYAHRNRIKKQQVLRQALAEFRERVESIESVEKKSTVLPAQTKPPKRR